MTEEEEPEEEEDLLGEKERGEVERERSKPDSLSSDLEAMVMVRLLATMIMVAESCYLEPGLCEMEEVREPAGEVTLGRR